MQPQTKRILIWAAGLVVFSGSLVGAAFLGIELARRDLPEAVIEAGRTAYPIGVIESVGGENDPVFLANSVQAIRDFWFAKPKPEDRAAADGEAIAELKKIESAIDVRTVRQDADAIQVDVLTGPARGQTAWIHVSQLPENQP